MICDGEQQNLATAFLDGSQIYGGVGPYHHLCENHDYLCHHCDHHDHHQNVYFWTAHKYMAGRDLVVIIFIVINDYHDHHENILDGSQIWGGADLLIIIFIVFIFVIRFQNDQDDHGDDNDQHEDIVHQVGGRGPGRAGWGGRLDSVARGLLPVII